MIAERWLRCEVQRGMFSSERSVLIAVANGRPVSAFVPASEVAEEPGTGKGRVRVRLISVSDGCWVLLPQENPVPISVPEVDFVG